MWAYFFDREARHTTSGSMRETFNFWSGIYFKFGHFMKYFIFGHCWAINERGRLKVHETLNFKLVLFKMFHSGWKASRQAGSMPQDVLKKREGWAVGCDEFLAECEVYNSTPLLIVIRSNKMLYEMGNAFYVLPRSSNEMCVFPLSAGTWWTLAGWEVVQCDS